MCRKVLDSETCTRYADVSKRTREFFCDVTRIQLERVLTQCGKVKTDAELRNELTQPLWAKNGGGSSTPMEMNDPPALRMIGDEIDLSDQLLNISCNWFESPYRLGMAPAVETYRFAKRNMKVERDCILFG